MLRDNKNQTKQKRLFWTQKRNPTEETRDKISCLNVGELVNQVNEGLDINVV